MDDTFTRPFTKSEMDAMRGGAREEATVRRDFWTKLKRLGGRIPFAEDLIAAYFCAVDPSTPNRVRLILMGAIAYFILPTDAVADFIPLLGFADDAAILAAAMTQVAGAITPEHKARAKAALNGSASPADLA